VSLPILAIETSCDETAAAVVQGRRILSSVVASQAELHAPYGGVVPEVAARHHLGTVNAVVDEALAAAGMRLADVGSVAVTQRPGLIGALLIGVATAKAIAYAARKPLVMVDHLHGHIAACWLEPVCLDPPYVSLVASGGHTRLPVGLRGAGTRDFSYAGVKTALLYAVRERPAPPDERERADLAASYQEAVLRPLADRLVAAAVDEGVPAVALGGGVAANGRLRELVGEGADRHGLRLAVPDRSLCTDNAAMIGAAAQFTEAVPWPRYLGLDAVATAPPGGIAA